MLCCQQPLCSIFFPIIYFKRTLFSCNPSFSSGILKSQSENTTSPCLQEGPLFFQRPLGWFDWGQASTHVTREEAGQPTRTQWEQRDKSTPRDGAEGAKVTSEVLNKEWYLSMGTSAQETPLWVSYSVTRGWSQNANHHFPIYRETVEKNVLCSFSFHHPYSPVRTPIWQSHHKCTCKKPTHLHGHALSEKKQPLIHLLFISLFFFNFKLKKTPRRRVFFWTNQNTSLTPCIKLTFLWFTHFMRTSSL